MLGAGLAIVGIAFALWLGSLAVRRLRDLVGWWRLRSYQQADSEMDRLQAVRAYSAWVRDMPPPPSRPRPGPSTTPTPVKPPLRGVVRPYPGRRMAG